MWRKTSPAGPLALQQAVLGFHPRNRHYEASAISPLLPGDP